MVDSHKVKKTKKNKGWKRQQWWQNVKDYHAKQADGSKGTPADGQDGKDSGPPTFPNAPWNQTPVGTTVKVDDDEEEEEPVDPPAIAPLFKGDKNDDRFDDEGSLGPMLMPKIFGP